MNLRPASVIAEPVTLAQAKLHLRVDDDGDSPPSHPDDQLIEALITAARQHCENFTGRAIATTDYEYRIQDFATCIALPMPPVVAVLRVEYQDADASWVTVDPEFYYLDDDPNEAFVILHAGFEWPTPGDFANPIRITYRSGYGDENSPPVGLLPKPFTAAMLLLIGHWYEHREAVVIGTIATTLDLTVESLLRPYRVIRGMA